MDGRPEKHPRREVVNAILYVVRSGCPWRYLPADLPPWQTVYWYFTRWEDAGVTEQILAVLRVKVRAAAGPRARAVGRDHRLPERQGRRHRRPGHAAATTPGRRSTAASGSSSPTPSACWSPCWVLAASWQDRDGAKGALLAAYLAAPPMRHLFADSGLRRPAGRLGPRHA